MDVRQLLKNIMKEAECPLCLDILKKPKTLPCLHSFCLECLDKHANFARRQLETTIKCPVCLTSFQIPEGDTFAGLPASFHLNRLVDVLAQLEALGGESAEAQKCTSCEGKNAATCYCFDCHDFFCGDCLRVHNRMTISRGHRNVVIENLQAQDVKELIHRPVMCAEKFHEKELLEYFCQECQVCICLRCGLVNHNRHAMVDVRQAAEEHKMQMMDVMEKVKEKVSACNMEMKKANELFEKSKEEILAAKSKVTATVEELVTVLREHETNMITKLHDIYETLQKEHAIQQKNFELFTAQLKSSVEYGEAILQRNISSEILQAKLAVIGHCEELLNSDKVDIQKFPYVDYVTNEENLQNVRCSILGQVVCYCTDPTRSVAEGNGLHAAEVGRETEFTLETKDSEEKLCYWKYDRVAVNIESPTEGELEKTIEDSKDGKYTVKYKAESVGQLDVVITVNGEPLPCCPLRVQVTPHQYQTVFTFGSQGNGQGQFNWPVDIAVSEKTGNIAVADMNNKRIQIFSSEGKFITEFGQQGPGAERLGEPWSVAFSRSGDVIVCHERARQPRKIAVFAESGEFIKHITNKHLKDPIGVSVGRDGHLIVCDGGDKTIKVLSPDGTELFQSFSAPDRDGSPWFAVYHQEKFFASCDCVKVFNKEGVFLYNIGSEGSGDGQFIGPDGLAVDTFGRLIVCDWNNNRLQVFTLDGKFVTKIEPQSTGLGRPCSVAVSNDGRLFVTDEEKDCVHVFQ